MGKAEELKGLEDAGKNCRKCILWRTRKNVVFGQGDCNSKILFVGEAPGANEDQKGIPFCGKAGDILNELLAHVGLKREQIYITNILKCRPPANRDPQTDEIEACKGYLERQIDIIQPDIICCLGKYALNFVLKMFSLSSGESISKVHGQVFRKEDLFNAINVVAFFHPAVATYDPGKIDVLKKDFELLKDFM